MTSSLVYTRALFGLTAPQVSVETHLANGLPRFTIVGLGDTAVRESKDRVRSALLSCGFEFPRRIITVNLSPANLPKDGSCYDLAIAISILVASEQIPQAEVAEYEFSGELALSGAIHRVRGLLPIAYAATEVNRTLCFPAGNNADLLQLPAAKLISCRHLLELFKHLRKLEPLPYFTAQTASSQADYLDLSDVRGQELAKRGMVVAAAGAHNVLLVGSPGSGKSMLAKRMPGLLPDMTATEAKYVSIINALSNNIKNPDPHLRPMRMPHHTTSAVAMIGGGKIPSPGEITMAHAGVLFLDELPEFNRQVLEALREPCEQGEVHIARAAYNVKFPARFQLVAAMNPCPCGYLLDPVMTCRCTIAQVQRYQARLSGPLLDRIGIRLLVNPPDHAQIFASNDIAADKVSDSLRASVSRARALQQQRQGCANADIAVDKLMAVIKMSAKAQALRDKIASDLKLSARSCHQLMRVARTIADLDSRDLVEVGHLHETYTLIKPNKAGIFS
jgi:magnesium chelatase family protein